MKNFKKQFKNNSGFMALISTIIISAVLLIVAVSLSLSGFYTRSNILDSELKEKSFFLAEGCFDVALAKLSEDLLYNPSNETISLGVEECEIVSVDTSGSHIKTQAKVNNAYTTNLRITIDTSDFSIESFEECGNFSASDTAC